MVFDLFQGAVFQAKKRALHLQEVAIANPRPDLRDIQRLCLERLKEVLNDLDMLIQDMPVIWKQDSAIALGVYRALSDRIYKIERDGVFSLIHSPKSDAFLTKLTQQVCEEINFPVLPPTVSQTSRTHYSYNRSFNLLFVPPLESQFLLHMPDLYHELCHPLFSTEYNQLPGLAAFRGQFATATYDRRESLLHQMLELDRREGPKEEMQRLNAWLASWAPDWLEELYCDLFAIFTLGPAYAWANCHLCLKLSTDPFQTPQKAMEDHPPNAARMAIMLIGLRQLGFTAEADHAASLWDGQVSAVGFQADMAYRQCFAPGVLEEIATSAFDVFEQTGLKKARPSKISGITLCLNQAWERFWSNPAGFGNWETQAIEHLQTELGRG